MLGLGSGGFGGSDTTCPVISSANIRRSCLCVFIRDRLGGRSGLEAGSRSLF